MIPRRRNLKGVLAGFLGTYTSRYSDYQGFWLFGFIVGLPNPLEIDLLGVQENALSRRTWLVTSLGKFREQLRKHGFELSAVRSARLVIEHGQHKVGRLAGDFGREGFDTVFRASVVADNEKVPSQGRMEGMMLLDWMLSLLKASSDDADLKAPTSVTVGPPLPPTQS